MSLPNPDMTIIPARCDGVGIGREGERSDTPAVDGLGPINLLAGRYVPKNNGVPFPRCGDRAAIIRECDGVNWTQDPERGRRIPASREIPESGITVVSD